MQRKIPRLALATCLAAWVLSSFAAVSVSFVEPERYTDLSDRNGYRLHHRDTGVLSELEKHFQTLSQRYLAAQQTLRIEVLDIDRAGRFEPWRSPYLDSARILRSVTWPRMKLRYTLEEHGQIVASGEETLSDQNYLMTVNRYFDSDSLRYEKKMLDEWFSARFGNSASLPR